MPNVIAYNGPPLSERVMRLKPPSIRAKEKRFKQMVDVDKMDGHGLHIGSVDLDVDKRFWNNIHRYPEGPLKYGPSVGVEDTRKAWAEVSWQKRGVRLAPDEITIAPGGAYSLFFTLLAVIGWKKRKVIVVGPFFPNYKWLIELAGGQMVSMDMEGENFDTFDPDSIEELIDDEVCAILINSPNNPSGSVLSRMCMERLVAIARRRDIWLLSDEVYGGLVYEGEWTSLLQVKEALELGVVFDSASKELNFCGGRQSATTCRNSFFNQKLELVMMNFLSSPVIEQVALCEVLRDWHGVVHWNMSMYRPRLGVVWEGLMAIPGVRCGKPKGAIYLFPELPIDDSERFADYILDNPIGREFVCVTPGVDFFESDKGRRRIRIALVEGAQRLRRAMELLKIYLSDYPGKLN